MHAIIIGQTNKNVRRGGIPSFLEELEPFLAETKYGYTLLEINEKKYDTTNRKGYASILNNFFFRAYLMRKKILELKGRHKNIIFIIHYWRELIFSLDLVLRHKFILHFHGPAYLEAELEGKSKLHVTIAKYFERFFYPKAKLAVCLSQHYKNLLVEKYDVKPELIHVVPYGFKISPTPKLLQKNATVIEFLCVRRLVKRVGIEILIEACALLKKNKYQFRLKIVGTGPLLELLILEVKRLNLEKNIFFLRTVDDDELAELYQKSDLSIIPSFGLEGFGISCVESLFYGTPVIATKIGGLIEILTPLNPKLLTTEATTIDLYIQLEKIINKEITLPTPTECQDFAIANYNIENTGSQLIELYKKTQNNLFTQ